MDWPIVIFFNDSTVYIHVATFSWHNHVTYYNYAKYRPQATKIKNCRAWCAKVLEWACASCHLVTIHVSGFYLSSL